MFLQLSYELLDNLDDAFVAVMTGSDTNPQTLAAALTAYSPSVYTASSSFDAINTTIQTLNTLNVSICMMTVLRTGSATTCLRCLGFVDCFCSMQCAPENPLLVLHSGCGVVEHGGSLTTLISST
jgi:hypothetical protein